MKARNVLAQVENIIELPVTVQDNLAAYERRIQQDVASVLITAEVGEKMIQEERDRLSVIHGKPYQPTIDEREVWEEARKGIEGVIANIDAEKLLKDAPSISSLVSQALVLSGGTVMQGGELLADYDMVVQVESAPWWSHARELLNNVDSEFVRRWETLKNISFDREAKLGIGRTGTLDMFWNRWKRNVVCMPEVVY